MSRRAVPAKTAPGKLVGLDLVPQAPHHAAPTELIGCLSAWRSWWSLFSFGPNRSQLVLNSSLSHTALPRSLSLVLPHRPAKAGSDLGRAVFGSILPVVRGHAVRRE